MNFNMDKLEIVNIKFPEILLQPLLGVRETVVIYPTSCEFLFYNFQVKCHQYWPEGEETLTFGDLEIICTKIRDFSPSYIYREMYVTDSKVLLPLVQP